MVPIKTNSNYPLSRVSAAARIHSSVHIEPFTTIEDDVEIGEGTFIGSNVTIHSGVRIGKGCYISPGTVISPEKKRLEFWSKEQMRANGIHSEVLISDFVHLEPNVTMHGGIVIGEGTWIGSNVTVYDGARVGKKCKIFPGAVISGIPQDLKFHGEKTTLEIGDNTTIRECVTLNRGTDYHGKTVIGKNVLIMAYVHIAHDCIIGDNVIISNSVNLAGHVEIGDSVVIGGVSAFRQFVKVGIHAFISGGSLVRKDVPPYVKAGREPLQYEGVNSIGLRRRGFSSDTIHHIQDIYRHLFLSGMNNTTALDYIEAHLKASEERDEVITFVRNASRGIIKGHYSHSSQKEEATE